MKIEYGSYIRLLNYNYDIICSGYKMITDQLVCLDIMPKYDYILSTVKRVERNKKESKIPIENLSSITCSIEDIEIIPPLLALKENLLMYTTYGLDNNLKQFKITQSIIHNKGDLFEGIYQCQQITKSLDSSVVVLFHYTSNNDQDYFIPVYKNECLLNIILRFKLMREGEKFLPCLYNKL